ncbi:DUF4190 domain-containing protein [Curtobacterium sp. Curtsp57]|jgi:hypothetical protein|uniref:DUF4190 domain-containing protein n=1 Tax=Curtobacterium sp. Curtsp57 TaxID=3243047 RepID=UPI00280920A4|nr:DUF4190 domain-containing protein [Patulibacter sp.]
MNEPPERYEPPATEPFNALAIAGFVLAFGATLIGLVICTVALVQIRRTGQQGKGLALAGLIISASATIAGTICLVIVGQQGLLPWQY